MKILVFIFALVITFNLWAYGTGYSTFPLMYNKGLFTTEITGIMSDGGGVGLQGRYTHKFNKGVIVDAGAGLSGGDRTGHLFVGADYEIYPDYMKQPRFSIKGSLTHANEGVTVNHLSLSPTVSKGFSFWGYEAFPFVAIPVALALVDDNKTYQSRVNLSMGLVGKMPVKGYTHLLVNVEGTISFKDSYSGLFCGVTYPLQ